MITLNSFHDAQLRTARQCYLQGTEITSTKEVSSVSIKHSIHHAETKNSQTNPWEQGRIYVANEYPTFARTMPMVGQKLTFSRQITSNVRQNLFVLMKKY